MRGATGVTIQPHQILRLSRRKTHILSPHRIWNVIYSARSNRCHHPTSPNTAPVTQKWLDCFIVITYETSFTMRGATGVTIQPHQILRLPRKMTHCFIVLTYETSFPMRGATGETSFPMLRLITSKITLDHRIWNVKVLRNRCHHRKTKYFACSRKMTRLHLVSSHMKRHLQCAEQQVSHPTSPNTAPATKNDSHT